MKSGGLVFKGLFFLVFAFCAYFGIMKGEPESLEVLFNISLAFWAIASLFLAALLAASEKVMPMLIDGYKKSSDKEKAPKQIIRATVSLVVNILCLGGLSVIFFLNTWFISAGIVTTFLFLYSVFVSQFLGALRLAYEL